MISPRKDIRKRQQCQLLGLNRSSLYYKPTGDKPEDLKLMRINEHNLMMQFGGPKSFNPLSPTYNKIFSPGRKLGGF
jgi:hypothetical protein